MRIEHPIIQRVYEAKRDMEKADSLIREYLPFIRSEASKCLLRPCSQSEDEFSIAMIAFHEAIRNYDWKRGPFLAYAALLIRSRIVDYERKEARHQGTISLYSGQDEETGTILDEIADSHNLLEESLNLKATRQEIEELGTVMQRFGVSFSDVAEHSPRQERTLEACRQAIRFAMADRTILDELLRTGKVPLSRLASGAGVERKTLERHRKYLVAMLLIQTNGYEIIRGHLHRVLTGKGGVQA